MEYEGKSEIRISKSETNSNFQNPNEQNYSYEDRVSIVWSIGALEFRICFVLRASYFEFDIQPPL